jgi:hypothetical protein
MVPLARRKPICNYIEPDRAVVMPYSTIRVEHLVRNRIQTFLYHMVSLEHRGFVLSLKLTTWESLRIIFICLMYV